MMGSDVSSTVSDPQGKILDSIFLDVFQEKLKKLETEEGLPGSPKTGRADLS